MLISELHRQGYREVKLHVILVGVMGTIYQKEKLLAIKIKNSTQKLKEHSIRHASTLIKTRYSLQYNFDNNSQDVGL